MLAAKILERGTIVLQTRILILSNELPKLLDASGTIVSRFIMFQLTESFYMRENHGLAAELEAELPQILLWAMGGWKRLNQRGHFIQPESGKERIEIMERLASPVMSFVSDRCRLESGAICPKSDVRAEFEDWCVEEGIKVVMTDSDFGEKLLAAFPKQVGTTRPMIGGKKTYCYSGIALITPRRQQSPDGAPR